MSFIIDFVIIAIIAVSVFVYARRGLVGVAIDIAGFILASLVAWYFSPMIGGYISGFMKNTVKNGDGGIVLDILTSDALARIIAFTAVFFICMTVVKFIVKLARSIKLPIISTADKMLGAILGLLLGIAWAQVASMVVYALIEILANSVSGFPIEAFEGLTVTRWFFEFNLFKTIFAVV